MLGLFRDFGFLCRQVSLGAIVEFELRLSWLFIRRNVRATVMAGTAFAVAMVLRRSSDVFVMLHALFAALAYFWLYAYSFDLHNQLTGVTEDRINKPDRPLVRGLVTIRGAQIRVVLVTALFLLLAQLLGTLAWAALSVAVHYINCHTHWHRHWLFKSAMVGVHVCIILPPAALIAGELSPLVWRWSLVVGGLTVAMIAVQDFRDVKGDAAVGRRTFPMVVGQRWARAMVSLVFLMAPIPVHLWGIRADANTMAWVAEGAAALLAWIVAVRVLRPQGGAVYDYVTYRVWEYWFVLMCIAVWVAS